MHPHWLLLPQDNRKTVKLTTFLLNTPGFLPPVTLLGNKQRNKVLEALQRAVMAAGCLYFCQQCRERKLNYPEWRH